MSKRIKKSPAAALAALCLLASLAAPAAAERDQAANLIGTFSGDISPARLPRNEAAPVSVQMGGKISTTDRATPPKLAEIVLQINSHGKLQTKGLGRCTLAKLNAFTSAQAKRRCADALIGHGNVTSRVSLPGQGAFASNGVLNAYNGTYKGRTAVLAQVESGQPLPLSYVIVFAVKKTRGTFGSELTGTLPPIASEYGYITAFHLSLGRRYTYRGKKLSYASASCPAPAGFSQAVFALAKASYLFDDGRVLSSVLERVCKVRG
jgi:hypothetical protein